MFIRFPSKLVQPSFSGLAVFAGQKSQSNNIYPGVSPKRGFPQILLFSGPQRLVCVKITLYHLHVVRKLSLHQF